ncbi:MAG: DUF3298 domain-containing protein [Bacteroidales bacterium]|nr:DUF3298 domain-containing protein [Bacteroidales bacterium]
MKKLFLPIALLLLVAASCNPKDPNEVDVETYSLCDSVFIESEYGDGYSRFNVNLDLPVTKNQTLRQNILHWMLSEETDDPVSYLEMLRDGFFGEDGSEPRSVYEDNYSLSEQTDKYVTYTTEGYEYTGGAHAMPWYNGTTFSKIDGSIVGYDLFVDPEQLIGIIAENIKNQYFEKDAEEGLFPEYEEITTLPASEPWIETDSVVFCYQAYEIASYAAGMPLCKIALTDLKPYLSEKGKTFLNP